MDSQGQLGTAVILSRSSKEALTNAGPTAPCATFCQEAWESTGSPATRRRRALLDSKVMKANGSFRLTVDPTHC